MKSILRKGNFKSILGLSLLSIGVISSIVYATNTPNFTIKINPGTLAIDVVDATNSYSPISSPLYNFSEVNASLTCLSDVDAPSMILGSNYIDDEINPPYGGNIYIQNPDASSDGFTVSLAPTDGRDAYWVGGDSNAYLDFSDSDCSNDNGKASTANWGPTAYSIGGKMYVDPLLGTIENGRCAGSGCTTTGLSLGSASSFDYTNNIDSVTLVQADATSDNIADYLVNGIKVSQTIPAQTPSGDYSLDMTMTVLSIGNSDITNPPLKAEVPITYNGSNIAGTDIYVGASGTMLNSFLSSDLNTSWSFVSDVLKPCIRISDSSNGSNYITENSIITEIVSPEVNISDFNGYCSTVFNSTISAKNSSGGVTTFRIHFGTGYDCGADVWKATSSECPPV